MSKWRKKIDGQYSLFDLIDSLQDSPGPEPGSLNIQYEFQGAIIQCIKQCPLSRWEIAGKMSALLNQEISKYMLDTWTAESKEYHRFPAEFVPAFCVAVDCFKPLEILARAGGRFVLRGKEALRVGIRRIEEEIKRLQKERQKWQAFLQEIERE